MTDATRPAIHLVFSVAGLSACLPRQHPLDTIVLMGDGAYAATSAEPSELLQVLAEDLALRGIDPNALPNQVQLTSYVALIDLIANSGTTVSWH
ncbi:MAG: DsrH/TusB family sulfur metabolism protein [Pseudomonadales bacterium]